MPKAKKSNRLTLALMLSATCAVASCQRSSARVDTPLPGPPVVLPSAVDFRDDVVLTADGHAFDLAGKKLTSAQDLAATAICRDGANIYIAGRRDDALIVQNHRGATVASLGVTKDAVATKIACRDGRLAVIGMFSGTLTHGEATISSAKATDAFAFSMASSSSWLIRLGGASSVWGNDIVISNNKVYAMATGFGRWSCGLQELNDLRRNRPGAAVVRLTSESGNLEAFAPIHGERGAFGVALGTVDDKVLAAATIISQDNTAKPRLISLSEDLVPRVAVTGKVDSTAYGLVAKAEALLYVIKKENGSHVIGLLGDRISSSPVIYNGPSAPLGDVARNTNILLINQANSVPLGGVWRDSSVILILNHAEQAKIMAVRKWRRP